MFWLLLLAASCALPLAAPAQICPQLSAYLPTLPDVSADFTNLVSSLDQYGYIEQLLSPPVTFFAPTTAAFADMQKLLGPQAGSGAGMSSITADETDRLLSLVFYQVVNYADTPAELEATMFWGTAFGFLTGAGEFLTFSKSSSKTLVQGMAPGNNATLAATPFNHCTSNVYVIDTVLLPTDQLADIPPFSSILAGISAPALTPSAAAAFGPGGAAQSPVQVFALALAPGPAARVSFTEAGTAATAAPVNGSTASAPGPAPAVSGDQRTAALRIGAVAALAAAALVLQL